MARAERVPQHVLAAARGDEFRSVGEAADDGHAGEAGGGGGGEGSGGGGGMGEEEAEEEEGWGGGGRGAEGGEEGHFVLFCFGCGCGCDAWVGLRRVEEGDRYAGWIST